MQFEKYENPLTTGKCKVLFCKNLLFLKRINFRSSSYRTDRHTYDLMLTSCVFVRASSMI